MSDEKEKPQDRPSFAQSRATENEALAQRVAEILADKMRGARAHGGVLGSPARVVGHHTLRCRACGHTRPADSEDSAGGCGGHPHLSHDFYGMETEVVEVDSLLPHHAIYIDGTVCNPAR